MANVAAAVLINEDRRVLLQLRDNKTTLRSAGLWSLPGGQIEQFESSETAVKREVFEETNILNWSPKFLMTLEDSFEPGPSILIDIYGDLIFPPYSIVRAEGQDLKFFDKKELVSLNMNKYMGLIIDYAFLVLDKNTKF
jgi:8-oxo-dGTP pyrophosphatase MutT (NUDIX family)